MMDYENVYYTQDGRNAYYDDDERNAVPSRAVIARRRRPMAAPVYTPPPAPVYVNPGSMIGYPVQPPYTTPQVAPPSNLTSILGGFGNVGSLANIIAQIFAALLPLPGTPPIAENNDGDSARNAELNSANLIKYQNALALFARRDQQILALGSVLKELFKRPGMVVS
jgi:hypothetical protein